jgi:hypothetical protein
MSRESFITNGEDLMVSVRRNEDDTNNGSLCVERGIGHVYCIAKAPRYTTNEEWEHNANLIAKAVKQAASPSMEQVIEVVEGMCWEGHDGRVGYKHTLLDSKDLLAKLKALQSDAATGNNQTEAGETPKDV